MATKFISQKIRDIVLIEPEIFGDERGFFLEVIKKSVFESHGVNANIVQVNHSKSGKGVLRGLHYQINPSAQGKIVSVVAGEIFDVAVDIRKNSPTYGQWAGVRLSSNNRHMLYIPEGFAHGFCVTSDGAEVIYYCTGEYSPNDERGILWDDLTIGIKWPVSDPVISEKDRLWPKFESADNNFVY